MPVFCEALSVIIKIESINARFKGGWDSFLEIIPNETFCADGEIARVGFMSLENAMQFLKLLDSRGLKYNPLINDIALYDAREIFIKLKPDFSDYSESKDCKWLQAGRPISFNDNDPLMCWMIKPGQKRGEITDEQLDACSFPDNVNIEKEDSARMYHAEDTRKLKYLRTEDGLDVYWDGDKQKEVYTTSDNDE